MYTSSREVSWAFMCLIRGYSFAFMCEIGEFNVHFHLLSHVLLEDNLNLKAYHLDLVNEYWKNMVFISTGWFWTLVVTHNQPGIILDVIFDIPAWQGRDLLDTVHERKYFGIKTDMGVMELECKNEAEYRLWTHGISCLLSLAQQQRTK